MTFLNPLDALIPKIPFSLFAEFRVRVTSGGWGSVSVGFGGGVNLALSLPFVAGARPNAAHRLLVQAERLHGRVAVLTQNVDGLHQAAGSSDVVALHGDLSRLVCCDPGCGWARRLGPGHDEGEWGYPAIAQRGLSGERRGLRPPEGTSPWGTLSALRRNQNAIPVCSSLKTSTTGHCLRFRGGGEGERMSLLPRRPHTKAASAPRRKPHAARGRHVELPRGIGGEAAK